MRRVCVAQHRFGRLWVHALALALACYCMCVSVTVNRKGWGGRMVAFGGIYMCVGGALSLHYDVANELDDKNRMSILAYCFNDRK